jgi:hypothetical protein
MTFSLEVIRLTCQKSDGLKPRARTDAGQDNYIFLLTLKSINCVEIDFSYNLSTKTIFEEATQTPGFEHYTWKQHQL